VRKAAPAFSGQGIDGVSYSLAEYAGRPIILHFWATWCVPCRGELPALQRLSERLGDRAVILSVSADGSNLSGVQKMCREHSVSFPVLMDEDGSIRKAYEIESLPVTYLIGSDGKFSGRIIGSRDWDADDLVNDLKKILHIHGNKEI
jgi:peroxiredoxin